MEWLKGEDRISRCGNACSRMRTEKWEAIVQAIVVFAMVASLLVLLLPQVQSVASNFLPSFLCCGNLLMVRFSVVFALFLVLFGVLDLVRRAYGFWWLKVLVIICGCWISVCIPPPYLDRISADFLLFGAMAFIVAQIYVLIRTSYIVIIKLHRLAENGSALARRLQIGFFIFGVIAPVIGEAILIYRYPLCDLNIVFLVTNAVIPFVACLWSMGDCVKAKNGYSGFAQGGIFACVIVLYTWSALANNPDPICNPYFGNEGLVAFNQYFFVVLALVVYLVGVSFTYNVYVQDIEESVNEMEEEKSKSGASRAGDQEEIFHVYMPQFTSFLGASMICFVVMSILNWSPHETSGDSHKDSKLAMWYQLIGCWFSVPFFIITLYTPGLYRIYRKKSLLETT